MFTNALKIEMQWAHKESDNRAHDMIQRPITNVHCKLCIHKHFRLKRPWEYIYCLQISCCNEKFENIYENYFAATISASEISREKQKNHWKDNEKHKMQWGKYQLLPHCLYNQKYIIFETSSFAIPIHLYMIVLLFNF